jgi:aspartate aminotransferase
MVEGLNGLGIACYVFPDIAPLLKRKYKQEVIKTANRFCTLLLKEAKVAAVPGEPFGNPANIRLSFATSRNNIEEGLKRIKDFLSELDGWKNA